MSFRQSFVPFRWLPLTFLGLTAGMMLLGSQAMADSREKAKRPPWTLSRVKGSPDPPLPYRAQRVFPNLGFVQPTELTSAPGTERLFVAEQSGRIYSIPDDPKCQKADLFLDATKFVEKLNASREAAEQVDFVAVYGLTFHPDFATNRKCYVCYVVRYKDGSKGQHPTGTRVVQLLVSADDPPTAMIDSETEIITWLEGGHNGGCLKFGPDGMLYISTGDGGAAFPPDGLNAGQDVTNLLAAVLRIDVDRKTDGLPYGIPSDNPFAASPAGKPFQKSNAKEPAPTSALPIVPQGVRKEIWAYGMRNPWKMSFDRKTGALWVGDVGWELWEMIYRVQPGDNFGWSIAEGRQPIRPDQKPGPTPIVSPVVEIPHTEAASITGGFVYRGEKLPELQGHYIFGDWETRRFWSIAVDGETIGPRRELLEPTVRIVGFAERNNGELLLLDYDDGSIHELVRNEAASTEASFPKKLSETGLFDSITAHTPAVGVVPFSINAPMWSDNALGERWLGLPGDTAITVHPQAVSVKGSMFTRSMDYPQDAVLLKTLSLELVQGDPSSKRRVETQILHFNGYDWRGYSYRWNESQTDAELVEATGGAATLEVMDSDAPGGRRVQTWRFPSRMECIRCHNPWAEFSLAFNPSQLNRGTETNQFEDLYAMGVLQDPPPVIDPQDPFAVAATLVPPRERPRLVDPFDESVDLDLRARAYLHANCAHCHRFNGGGSARIYLPFDTSIHQTEALSTRPAQGSFGIPDAMIIAPSDPDRSVLYFRMAKSGSGHMPHLGSTTIDEPGLALVHDWIRQLPMDMQWAKRIEELAKLDEPSILQKEQRDSAHTRWSIARQIGSNNGRKTPTQADMDAALLQAKSEAQSRISQREKQRGELLKELLNDPRGAIALARACREAKLSPFLKTLAAATATQHDNIAVRDLFDAFLPDEDRIQRLGDAIDPKYLLGLKGDVTRGRDLFLNAKGISCRNCHKVGEEGKSFGPDLNQVGKKLNREKLIESLLEPSRNIDPKFAGWLVQTAAGQVLTGLLESQNEQEVVLRDAEGKLHKLAKGDIEEMFPQRTSLMPDRQLRDLTSEQAADLLEWLESLK